MTVALALPPTIAGVLVLSFLSAIVPARRWNPRPLSLLLATLASAGLGVLGMVAMAGGEPVHATFGQVLGFAVAHVRYDRLAGFFLLALGIVGLAASLFGIGYERSHAGPPDRTRAAYPVFLGSLALVFGADDAFAFLMAWELMALSSAVLVVGARPSREVANTGFVYLTLTHLATAALVVAFGLLAATAGSTDTGAFRAAAAGLTPLGRSVVFLLLLVGFGTKAGAIPLHVWLPRAHPIAPSHVSALMSGVMIKAGVYGLVRFGMEILGPGPEWWGLLVLAVGVVSAVLGILYALMEPDLKRLLAFSSIENIGIILIGIGVALVATANGAQLIAGVALTAALFHTFNHAIFKSALFLAAGSVQAAAGTRDLNRLGGLARAMPVTALAFGIGAAAISGLPPLNGFASEWLVFQSLIGAGTDQAVSLPARAAALLAVGGLGLAMALAVACFVKATGMTFLALPRGAGPAPATEGTRSMVAPLAGLAALCAVVGVAAGPVAEVIGAIAGGVVAFGQAPAPDLATPVRGLGAGYAAGPIAVVLVIVSGLTWLAVRRRGPARRVSTWAGGVVHEAAFEYTASSYAKLIRLYFGPVLRPAREITVELHPGTPFPRTVRYHGRVSHVIDERLYKPLHLAAVAGAQLVRRLQSGSLQLYLAYAVSAVIVLLLVAR